MRTKETEAAPELAARNQAQDDQEASSGEFAGSWTDFVGRGKEKELVAKAAEESPTGTKIRAAARVYKRAKAGDPRAVRAVQVMVAKAKAGDPQALRDVNAMKAARLSLATKKRAQRRQLVAKVRAEVAAPHQCGGQYPGRDQPNRLGARGILSRYMSPTEDQVGVDHEEPRL